MKTLKRIAALLAVSTTLFISTPLMAQNDPNNTTASSGRDNDNDHNWSWVGLIGLLGFLGLKRKDDRRTANYSKTNTGGNR
jgi:hypothetical protein